ncbi:hypothetical protein LCGC14_2631940 [marine sediment metagenome]|uniref:Uncharacterized protein n=1 Tax=marine sediment metagenome TaxID=412755 RepID=A0A0F9CB05_9ZZZZ
MIACLGIYNRMEVCDRCSWRGGCSTDTNSAYCPGSGVYTSNAVTEVEFEAVESEEVDEPKIVPAFLPYPARRVIVDRRKFVLMTAPRRLQRGRNYGR